MNKALKIKVCGMREPSNLEGVCALGPDYVGFIFVRRSPRYVGPDPDPGFFSIPHARIRRVGVFVDEAEEVILGYLERGYIDMVQLHGSESPEACLRLADRGVQVIKALPSAALSDAADLEKWRGVADFLLLDSARAGEGGSGRKFDWGALVRADLPCSFFLSGGIVREDAYAIRTLLHPGFYAVDVNSGFETAPGLKDELQLEAFIKELRSE